MVVKRCTTCGESKDISLFDRKKISADGHVGICKSCRKIYMRKVYQNNIEYYKEKARKNRKPPYIRHGMVLDDFNEMVDKFQGLCWICRVRSGKVIDHDHSCCIGSSCGRCVRGWLCDECNKMLGMAGDKVSTLINAITYLGNGSRKGFTSESTKL